MDLENQGPNADAFDLSVADTMFSRFEQKILPIFEEIDAYYQELKKYNATVDAQKAAGTTGKLNKQL